MDARRSIWVIVLCVAALGCRTDPSIELLESELRWYEDQLFMQSRELDRRCDQLESCRKYNEALKQELRQRKQAKSSRTRSDVEKTPSLLKDDFENLENMELEIPSVEYGSGTNSPSQEAEDDSSARPKIQRDEQTDPFGDESADTIRPPSQAPPVTQIQLNQRLTGGYDSDRKRGDEGVMVVIEPQDQNGQYLPIPAEVTVEAFELGSSSNRIARWDFNSHETASFMKESLFGKGVHLRLPWPAEAPQSDRIRVVARYLRADGKRLEARRDVKVDSAHSLSIASGKSFSTPGGGRFVRSSPSWKSRR